LYSGKVVGIDILLLYQDKTFYMSLQRLFTATLSGIVIGILIAPAKGADTRKKINNSVENIKDKIKRLRGTTNEELDELHRVFEQEVAGLREDVREKVLHLIEVSKKSYNHVKSEALS
jgi:gas vesicle protein